MTKITMQNRLRDTKPNLPKRCNLFLPCADTPLFKEKFKTGKKSARDGNSTIHSTFICSLIAIIISKTGNRDIQDKSSSLVAIFQQCPEGMCSPFMKDNLLFLRRRMRLKIFIVQKCICIHHLPERLISIQSFMSLKYNIESIMDGMPTSSINVLQKISISNQSVILIFLCRP